MIENAINALLSVEFGAGFRLGLIAAVLGGLGLIVWRVRTGQPGQIVGVLFTGVVVLAMKAVMEVPPEGLLGLALLGIGGLLTRPSSESQLLRGAAAIPGAWFVVGSVGVGNASWVSWFLFSAVVGGAVLVARTDQLLSTPIVTPFLLTLTIGGAYFAVPDTEEVLVLVGAIVPLAFLGWPARLSRIGGSGSYMTVGVLVWATAWGGLGRPAAIVGAISCLGIFLLVPFLPRLPRSSPLVVGLHAILVAAGSRLAGQQTHPKVATLLAAAALGVGYLIIRYAAEGDQKR